MLAKHDRLPVLIFGLAHLDHATKSRAFGIVFLPADRHDRVDCISDVDGFGKTEALISVGEGARIDLRRGKADPYGKSHGSVGYPGSERLRLAPLLIHVVREKVSRMASVNNDICFRDGPACRPARIAYSVILKVLFDLHSSPPTAAFGLIMIEPALTFRYKIVFRI